MREWHNATTPPHRTASITEVSPGKYRCSVRWNLDGYRETSPIVGIALAKKFAVAHTIPDFPEVIDAASRIDATAPHTPTKADAYAQCPTTRREVLP